MEFNECRQKVFLDIASVLDNRIDSEQVFLLLGGIRAGIYQYKRKGLPFFIPGGMAEIHYPRILEMHGIEYRQISIDTLLLNVAYATDYLDCHILILLFNESILRKRTLEEVQQNVFGDSQLTIREIDIDQNRIILNHEDSCRYWVDLKLYQKIEQMDQISFTNKICIYEIDKRRLHLNLKLIREINRPKAELLKYSVAEFMKEHKEIVKTDFIRFDGKSSYKFLLQNLCSLRNEYKSCNNQIRFELMKKYIDVMANQYKKFTTVGSEANYRNEFAAILSSLDGEINLGKSVVAWKEISLKWIQITLRLTKLLADEHHRTMEILDELIDFHEDISKREFQEMEILMEVLR
jgi:2'-5' RNA ligase